MGSVFGLGLTRGTGDTVGLTDGFGDTLRDGIVVGIGSSDVGHHPPTGVGSSHLFRM
ncbi:MAG: hypothetical protein UX04_C0006G0030 [Microgenomates group bacterium GW2011_GWF2_45_18]|nr:MAG: hypothetical protein UW18_C0006G0030 [Microgenomates group bacterium GW2011_GWF1_44_10]KKU01495.1 MAG: hypothetical protein UX04_C0006G0030 [Microgenomates group bacterium GW2011_GWF2_45_18]